MQIVLHAGAHFTDEERLLKCLARNREMLAEHGVFVPRPRDYRDKLRNLLGDMEADSTFVPTLDAVITLPEEAPTDRVILHNENIFRVPKLAARKGKFYHGSERRLQDLAKMFEGHELELFFGMRDPATFLPAIVAGTPAQTVDALTGGVDPLAMRWSEFLLRLRSAAPDISITVWCNEDTPLIWEEILREMAGLSAIDPIEGGHDLLEQIMTPQGFERFEDYLEKHPGMTQIQKRRVIAAFLDKFADDSEIEEELDLPGWTEEYVDTLSDIYDEDVYEIQRIPGVNFITP